MKIHFIAIGGAAMHNLALALHQLGHTITGSDDEIFEPSRGRLEKAGLLPDSMGWDAAMAVSMPKDMSSFYWDDQARKFAKDIWGLV